MFKTVLFPIDQSREAREAADIVANIVQKYNSRLILLSVVEEPNSEASTTSPMVSSEIVAQLLENARTLFSEQGITAELLERQGKPAFTICDVADEIEASLIIMGCRGLGLTEEGSTDSVTTRVINLSPCPVLIVP
ncbi:universal stress protein [Dolichospermum planctonicum CS-1226]|jgi:nucleotide-binding universal stress UspA family protein|uniref:UspA domain-containing protein n=2 Tax=Dolichospermum planctonicum TaxID=136072 RepID=A0A480AGY4_9CYAN|nr:MULTISPECIES: universal stress protein [Nostocales]MBD2140451.1 universal stress protein [Anabaena sp. FACHB-1250]MBD2269162.1 universal stress protein [Anabaena sp. FACHB-1391]MCW9682760.1 universal stress protein [Dolichospermum planctonicum UHCC 0167]MDB9468086.1 universal stress protein [Dolichospermum circinale CS-539/09]MDB9471333.1 universal stress protein [Dolichospermum circinale CS-539]